jgi:hypothetical protein
MSLTRPPPHAFDLNQRSVRRPRLAAWFAARARIPEIVQRQKRGYHRIVGDTLSKTRWAAVHDVEEAPQPEPVEFENQPHQLAGGAPRAGIRTRFERVGESLDLCVEANRIVVCEHRRVRPD